MCGQCEWGKKQREKSPGTPLGFPRQIMKGMCGKTREQRGCDHIFCVSFSCANDYEGCVFSSVDVLEFGEPRICAFSCANDYFSCYASVAGGIEVYPNKWYRSMRVVSEKREFFPIITLF